MERGMGASCKAGIRRLGADRGCRSDQATEKLDAIQVLARSLGAGARSAE